MIEFNLLPDIKMQFIKAQRTKRLVVFITSCVTIVAIVIFAVLLLYVDVAQKKHLKDLDSDISSNSAQLKSNTNLNRILTVQNQLSVLPTLEGQVPVSSLVLPYMTQLVPTAATVSDVSVDFGLDTFSVTGNADTLNTVDQFVDAVKFTKYTTDTDPTPTLAFNTVVLSSFGYSKSAVANKPATFTITFGFDPTIFSPTDKVVLNVPSQVTTRSVIAQPTDLFDSSTATAGGGK